MGKVSDNLNLYKLVEILHAESFLIFMQVELLSQKKLKKKKVDRTVQKLSFEKCGRVTNLKTSTNSHYVKSVPV